MSVVPLPAPVALGAPGRHPDPSRGEDTGLRGQVGRVPDPVFGGEVYSRNGTNLTRLFPDLAPVLTIVVLRVDHSGEAHYPPEARLMPSRPFTPTTKPSPA